MPARRLCSRIDWDREDKPRSFGVSAVNTYLTMVKVCDTLAERQPNTRTLDLTVMETLKRFEHLLLCSDRYANSKRPVPPALRLCCACPSFWADRVTVSISG